MPKAIDSKSDQAAHEAALNWLLGRINYERTAFIPYRERQLKLDRMRQLLTRLGQPDAGLKIIHVAGTKGKGSTSAMIAAVLAAAGYRTGVFSSPHLERIEERFAVDGQPCAPNELVSLVHRVRPLVEAMDAEAAADGDPCGGPTYFEVTTAMALVHFVERKVDAAVLEVGLGGRLDSTNVCLPVVSVITSISFDHMRQLGNTLAAIAREKAGIVKSGVPVICGVTQSEPQKVIAEVAREHGCRLIQLGDGFWFRYLPPDLPREGDSQIDAESSALSPGRHDSCYSRAGSALDFCLEIPGLEWSLGGLQLAMRGRHQAINAAVALATLAELRHQGWCISNDAVKLGLSCASLAGRVEVVPGQPTVVLDTAHNPASAAALVEALAEMPGASRQTLVLSISYDKDVRAIVDQFAPYFDRFIVTQYQENPRAVPADDLASIVRQAIGGTPVSVIHMPSEAWRYVCQTAIPRERVCIAGSFYLAAEMRPLVLKSLAANRGS